MDTRQYAAEKDIEIVGQNPRSRITVARKSKDDVIADLNDRVEDLADQVDDLQDENDGLQYRLDQIADLTTDEEQEEDEDEEDEDDGNGDEE